MVSRKTMLKMWLQLQCYSPKAVDEILKWYGDKKRE